jgi:hypothetical protein
MEAPDSKLIKDSDRKERDKLREMNFKEKLDHIWEYYKFFIIGFVAAAGIIISVIYSIVLNPSPEPALFISWHAGFATNSQIDDLKELLEDHLIAEDLNEEVVISQLFFDENNPETLMIGHHRAAAMIAAGGIDLFTLDDELLEVYSSSGFLLPLESILAQINIRNPDVYSSINEYIVYALYEVEEDVFEERIIAIEIGKNPLFSRLGIIEQEMYLSVSITSGNIENVIKAITLLFE